MGKLGAIVGILLRIVNHARQNCSLRSTIALQFVGDDPERFFSLALHQSAQESLRCAPVPSRLQQNIDDITVLIHGTPKILLLAVNSDEQFIQIPAIAEATLSPFQLPNVVWTELLTPASNRFIGNGDASLSQKILDITEAHAEAMIDPHGVADDFRWESVSMVLGSSPLHDPNSFTVACPT